MDNNYKEEILNINLDSIDKDKINIYLGYNAGKNLENDINNAKESIVIVSPFINENKVDTLIKKSYEGINVSLYFSEKENINYDEKSQAILRKIIKKKQKQTTEGIKINVLSKFKLFLTTFMYIILCIIAPISGLTYLKHIKIFNNSDYFLFAICIYFIFLVVSLQIFKKIKKKFCYKILYKQITYYEDYYENINKNIHVCYCLKNDQEYLHSKFYVIDKKIVYLGSLNYTHSGFKNSIETSIKIQDESIANQFAEAAKNLYKYINYHNIYKDSIYGKSLGSIIYNVKK